MIDSCPQGVDISRDTEERVQRRNEINVDEVEALNSMCGRYKRDSEGRSDKSTAVHDGRCREAKIVKLGEVVDGGEDDAKTQRVQPVLYLLRK